MLVTRTQFASIPITQLLTKRVRREYIVRQVYKYVHLGTRRGVPGRLTPRPPEAEAQVCDTHMYILEYLTPESLLSEVVFLYIYLDFRRN